MTNDPAATPRDEQIDAAFAAYLRSCDVGDSESEDPFADPGGRSGVGSAADRLAERERFLAQFPALEPELRKLIATADMLQHFTRPVDDTPQKTAASDAETIGAGAPSLAAFVSRGRGGATGELPRIESDGQDDPNSTLPADNRPVDHPGPRLPFVLGDYELQRMIGRGGMGVVYLASQRNLDRQVAVKMIRSGMLAGDEEVRRFRSEARSAARLQHPGIVTVHHSGYLEGHHYFSMDYVEGTDLARKMADGPLEIRQALIYVRDSARAIHYAHQCGILHRDLKPANILIDQYDQVRITDFGLAKHIDSDSSLTASGAAVGTPHYMAPEQAGGHGDRAGRAADVYALGAILFSLLTGRPPFVGETVVQTLMQAMHRPAPSPREFRPEISTELETVVLKCLEKEPRDRYGSADELSSELNRVLQGRPILARRRNPLHRVWHWFLDVPVVAAIAGRRFLEASETHRRVQAGFLALIIILPLIVIGLVAVDRWNKGRMPEYVRIAGGIGGGAYDDLSGELAHRIMLSQGVDATVVSSDGSVENRQRLLDREVDLAPMQASTIRGDQLCVVAPLFYEVVHVLVRSELNIETVADLRDHVVAIGPEGSGSRLAAELLFDSYGLADADLQLVISSWRDLKTLSEVDAAILCIGTSSSLIPELLRQHKFRLIEISDSIRVSYEHPMLKPLHLPADVYADGNLPPEGYNSVGMTAFMAARIDSPDVLVEAALAAIYADPPLFPGMIPKRGAAEFQGMQLHPAARKFFDQ